MVENMSDSFLSISSFFLYAFLGKQYKLFYGMSSATAMKKHAGEDWIESHSVLCWLDPKLDFPLIFFFFVVVIY